MPRDVDGIVDRIDELVDAQLAVGPVDDYHADRYDRCPHCGRHWHGIPVTEQIDAMYGMGVYDEGYSTDSDDSPVLCQGSDFIGPMPHEGVRALWLRGGVCATVTLGMGNQSQTWPMDHCRTQCIEEPGALRRYEVHILAPFSPDIGGTWEPMTAPGVTEYPQNGWRR